MASNLAVVEQIAQRLFMGGGGSGVQAMVAAVNESLPTYFDDLTRDLGPQVYRQMMRDTTVYSAVDTRRLGALSADIRIVPAPGVDPKNESDPRNQLAQRARDDISSGRVEMRQVLHELFDGLLYGIKVAECVLVDRNGRLVPKSADGLEEESYVLLENGDREFLGIAPNGVIGAELAALLKAGADTEGTRGYWRQVIPAWKLLKLANHPRNGRILGSSILRPAYQPWFSKTKLIPEYLKFLSRFGSPSVVGKLSADVAELNVKKDSDGLPIVDESGEPILENAVRQLFEQLLGFRNGSVFAGPNGTDISLIWPQGNGPSFPEGHDLFKREIHEVILGTAQTTVEAQYESRSAKGVAQDVTGLRIADDRFALGLAANPLLRLLVLANEGERFVDDAPRFQIASSEQHDLGEVSQAFQRLQATPGALLPSQRRFFWDLMGLPVDEAELADDLEQRREDREARRVSDIEMEELLDPTGGRRAAVNNVGTDSRKDRQNL